MQVNPSDDEKHENMTEHDTWAQGVNLVFHIKAAQGLQGEVVGVLEQSSIKNQKWIVVIW